MTLPRLLRVLVLAVAVSATAGCAGAGNGTATAPPNRSNAARSGSPVGGQTRQQSLAARLLSGTFAVPAGFVVSDTNPDVPADAIPYGAVNSTVTSAAGAAYDIRFSPVVVPCEYALCTSSTSTLALGDSAPAGALITLTPEVGAPARCGYDQDLGQVGCDAIQGSEYVAVSSSAPGASTADAITILRAATSYLVSSGG